MGNLKNKKSVTGEDLAKLQREGKFIKVKVEELDENGNIVEESDWKEIVAKKWYASKTIIFNIFVAIFTGIGSIVYDDSFKGMIGDQFFPYLLTTVTIVNVYLRTITNSAVRR